MCVGRLQIAVMVAALALAGAAGCTASGARERVGPPSRLEGRYTCRAHPEVHQSTPGDCPICGEDLERDVAGYGGPAYGGHEH